MILDVTTAELRREQIAQRAREVIQRNLHTVQDVACKLGENMAETEILLRSLAEGFTSEALHENDTADAPAEIPVQGWGTKP